MHPMVHEDKYKVIAPPRRKHLHHWGNAWVAGFNAAVERGEFAKESKKKVNSATLRPSWVVSTAHPHLALNKVIFQIRDKAC
jgi:hypothetical protein